MPKVAVGMMRCQCCPNDVVVKKNERGTLSYTCQFCDDAPYQKQGSLAYKSWESRLRPMFGAEPENSAAPVEKQTAAAPAEKPKAERKTSGTLLG